MNASMRVWMFVLRPVISTAVNIASISIPLMDEGELMEYLVEYPETDNDKQTTNNAAYCCQQIGSDSGKIRSFN
jgi:predicted amino acid-binding ACT domain protein